MSRNEGSRFAINPTNIDISRSTFSRNHSVKTSFNVGDVVPIYVDEVLPGDTFSLDTAKVVRMQSLITPMMDNLYLDTYFFFVPNRLVWRHWQEFCGENTESAWIPQTVYQIPQIEAPSGGWNVGTIADYMGLPVGVDGISVSALPFRSYALIMNEWFRDQNLQDPLNIPVDETTITGVNTGDQVTDIVKGGLPFIANKYHDYFTSALPAPQKGPAVTIPLAGNFEAPVYGDHEGPLGLRDITDESFHELSNRINSSIGWLTYSDAGLYSNHPFNVVSKESQSEPGSIPSNLWADLTDNLAAGISVNTLRLAFQIQKLYEKDARGGTRYIELLKSHFGVTSPDARLQRPEYLGGNRIPININQVIQQSETGTTPLGDTAAYSLTSDVHSDFTKSFVEHGLIIGLAVARYDHTYQQGIQRFWSRKDRFDFYWPVLANIGEQPILRKEIYATGTLADDNVFGYNEAWADYRYKPSYVTGEMRSAAQTSLDAWHLADDYSSTPYLSADWIREDSSNVDRVIAVSSRVSNQLFGDFYFKCKATRAMPLYSIPGLIDHH